MEIFLLHLKTSTNFWFYDIVRDIKRRSDVNKEGQQKCIHINLHTVHDIMCPI